MTDAKRLFFLSYASANRERARTEFDKFVEDLVHEVEDGTRIRDETAVVDRRELQVGQHWEPTLLTALQSSRALVCMFSTKFLQSDWCGLEFEFFSRRIEAWHRAHPQEEKPALIIPVLWEVGPAVTEDRVLNELQQDDINFPDDYRTIGLKQLMRTAPESPAYWNVIHRLATVIKERIEERDHELPQITNVPSPHELGSAFRSTPGSTVASESGGTIGRAVRFIYAAAKQDDLHSVQVTTPERYGVDSFDWRPFFPPHEQIVDAVARKTAALENLSSREIVIDDVPLPELLDRIAQEHQRGHIVIALVDSDSLRVERIASAMKHIDTLNYGNFGVIVTNASGVDEVSQVFRNSLRTRHSREFIDDVMSLPDLEDRLTTLISRLRAFTLEGSDNGANLPDSGDSPPSL